MAECLLCRSEMLPIHGRLPPCPISYTYLNYAVSTHSWSHSCENTVRNYAVLVFFFLLWNRNTFIPGWPLSHYMIEADLEPWFSFLYLLNSGIISRYHKVWIIWIYFILFKWGSRILGLIFFCSSHPRGTSFYTGDWRMAQHHPKLSPYTHVRFENAPWVFYDC